MVYESICLLHEAMKSSWWLEFRCRLRKVSSEAGKVDLGQVVKNLTYCERFEKYICVFNRLPSFKWNIVMWSCSLRI